MSNSFFSIEKKNNQYYGEAIERLIFAYYTGTDPDEELKNINFIFSENEINIMKQDAKDIFVPNIKKLFGENQSIVYTGRTTKNANGDLIINGSTIEIKYTASSNGTYASGSAYYFHDSFGMIDPMKFYANAGYHDILRRNFPVPVSESNRSPVSQEASNFIRHSSKYKDVYARVLKVEAVLREMLLQRYDAFFKENPSIVKDFVYGLISKEANGKEIPDHILIYQRKGKNFVEITKEYILSTLNEDHPFCHRGDSYYWGPFRFTVGWQNGNGLNNFSLRIFINK